MFSCVTNQAARRSSAYLPASRNQQSHTLYSKRSKFGQNPQKSPNYATSWFESPEQAPQTNIFNPLQSRKFELRSFGLSKRRRIRKSVHKWAGEARRKEKVLLIQKNLQTPSKDLNNDVTETCSLCVHCAKRSSRRGFRATVFQGGLYKSRF